MFIDNGTVRMLPLLAAEQIQAQILSPIYFFLYSHSRSNDKHLPSYPRKCSRYRLNIDVLASHKAQQAMQTKT